MPHRTLYHWIIRTAIFNRSTFQSVTSTHWIGYCPRGGSTSRATTLSRLIGRQLFFNATRGDAFIRSGNWHGNRTTWRMCVDLNRCLYYSDREGQHFDAPAPVRRVFTLIDGIVAGEGEGPLAPRDVPLGVVVAGSDPIAVDLACVRLMGFDERRLPKLMEPMRDARMRVTDVRGPGDVEVVEVDASSFRTRTLGLDAIACERVFEPHPGWKGHVERAR